MKDIAEDYSPAGTKPGLQGSEAGGVPPPWDAATPEQVPLPSLTPESERGPAAGAVINTPNPRAGFPNAGSRRQQGPRRWCRGGG